MTYTDLTAQSPETQAAVEQEVRVLLKVGRLQRQEFRDENLLFFLLFSLLFKGLSLFFCFFFSVQDSYERAKSLLKSRAKEHKKLAEALLLYETLDAKEIQLVLEGKTLETR